MHRLTLLGWTWPLARQLAQLAVLVFVFSTIFDLGIPDYPLFVFSGLLAWTWFADGLTRGTWSVVRGSHLLRQPRFPALVLPVAAVGVALVDVMIGLPVLLGLLVAAGELSPTALLVPLIAVVQFGLMVGIALVSSAVSVHARDIPNLVTVGLTVLFYMTPVFFPLSRVPEEYQPILRLNPLTDLIGSYRAVLIDGDLPGGTEILWPLAAAALLIAGGLWTFRRLETGFVDRL